MRNVAAIIATLIILKQWFHSLYSNPISVQEFGGSRNKEKPKCN